MAADGPVQLRLRALAALRHRDFRPLFLGQAVSLIGDAAFVTALGWRTYELAGAGRLGIVLACQASALLATLLIGGALADRLPRRRLMIAADLGRLAVVAALAAVEASGHLSFELLVLFATLVGLGDGLFYPAFGGMTPLLVDEASLASANALIGVARWSAVLAGPVLAGFVYGPAGATAVWVADACSFLVSAVLVYRTRPRTIEAAKPEGTLREIVAGARYVATVPWLWVTISLFAGVLMLQLAPQQVLLPKLVDVEFGRGIESFALLSMLFGAGTVAGALLYGQLQPRRRRGVLTYTVFIVNSLATVGIGLAPWFELAGMLSALRGVCVGLGVAIWETMLMELVPANLLSRVVSLDYFGSFGLMPVGLALWAVLAGVAAPGTLIAAGAAASALLLAVPLFQPWLREIE
jgi:MFS family permease